MGKSLNGNVATVTRTPVALVEKITDLQRLYSLIQFMRSIKDDGKGEFVIQGYGKLVIDADYNFEFIPTAELKKEVIGIRKNGSNYLRSELKRALEKY